MNALDVVALHRHNRSVSASAGAPLKLRLRVYVTRGTLDRQIASGRPYLSTPTLALRAQQLAEPRTRRQVARTLREIVEHADRRTAGRVLSAVVVEPIAVRRARHPILGLAERLESTARLNPAGVARAQVLITDALSPLFDRHCPRTATQAIYEVQDALEAELPYVLDDGARS
jgi:hypothetical protein